VGDAKFWLASAREAGEEGDDCHGHEHSGQQLGNARGAGGNAPKPSTAAINAMTRNTTA
jgi:hypothetical protein